MTLAAPIAGAATALAVAGLADVALGWRRRRARRGLAALLARSPVRAGGLLGRVRARWRPAAGAAARLDAAGLDGAQAPQLAAVRGAAALAGLAFAALLAPGLPARWVVLEVVAASGAGYLSPDVWLRRRAQQRGRAIAAELADVLDLLRVAASAGLPVRRALTEVGRRHPGVLAARRAAAGPGLRGRGAPPGAGRPPPGVGGAGPAGAAARLGLGAPDDDVLAAVERRCPAEGIPALTAAITRARRLGAPLAGTLAAQAEQARAGRAQRCAEAAARASPKIQLVVALLLVPSVLLLVAAALIPSFVAQ